VETANYAARPMSTKRIRIVAATALAAGKLLTTREAGRILGTPVGSTKRTSNAQADSCTWNAK
jgi:hypothetical protein